MNKFTLAALVVAASMPFYATANYTINKESSYSMDVNNIKNGTASKVGGGEILTNSELSTASARSVFTTRTKSKSAYRWPSVTVSCNDDEVLTGGGGHCSSLGGKGWMFMPHSRPKGNSWAVGCDTPEKQNARATAYAICMKVSN
ncbi:hypothetical protein QX249_10325 [Vibrio parahaemolyticus]|uniref:Uncharacterized protein n=1 Tax=Vibrio parahaemolyticus TaxID=670 RepID=A0AAW8Q1B3_VIBPH|nr:hypothetical protein [Vibrio parahaemolyticus]MDS1821055.1 hypothetical protein [Vibrio parahaemolyticus]